MIYLEAFPAEEEFHKHLANHLERFAAFAFPGDVETISGDGSSLEGSVIASARADARSSKSYELESFNLYTLEDLKAAPESVLVTAELVAQLPSPAQILAAESSSGTLIKYVGDLSSAREMLSTFEKIVLGGETDPLPEE